MKNIGIRARVLLTVLPFIVSSLLLGVYAVSIRVKDLEHALKERGNGILGELVRESRLRLIEHDISRLEDLAASIVADADVLEILIMDPAREVLARRADNGKKIGVPMEFTAPVYRDAEAPKKFGESARGEPQDSILGWIELRLSRASVNEHLRSTIYWVIGLIGGAAAAGLMSAWWMGRGIVHEVRIATRRLSHTIETLELQNRDLDRARQEALTASQEKASFLANMSHEIRTPINAMLGYAALLDKSGLTPEQTEYSRTIQCASRQLLRLIDDVLTFSRLESGSVKLDSIAFDVRDTFEDILSMLAHEAHDKGLELALIVDPDVPAGLVGDPFRIGQVLTNLVGNAIKFTEQGEVIVHVALHRGTANHAEIEVRVSDTGIGFDEETSKKIFAAFHQADASTSRRYGGAGLGLAIVTRLVKLWNGQLGVSSELNKGSTFWFRFGSEVVNSPSEHVSDSSLAGRRILLYEENPSSLRAIRHLLLGWSTTVFVAHDLPALKGMLEHSHALASGEKYDLVVLGINHARQGDESESDALVDLIRQRYRMPLLLMINQRHTSLLSRSLGDEAVKVIVKPLRRDVMHRNLRALLGLRTSPPAPEPAADRSPGEFEGLRVLLVEDNDFNRDLVTEILEAADASVFSVGTGGQAIEAARMHEFDLIILDSHLPDMGGVETARQLRDMRKGLPAIPIIGFTADIFFPDEKPKAAQMDAFLLKPLNETELLGVIRRFRLGSGTPHPDRVAAALDGSFSARQVKGLEPRLMASIHQQRGRIAQAITLRDVAGLRSVVHELKGTVGYFGLTHLIRAVTALEQAIEAGADFSELTRRVQLFEEIAERAAVRVEITTA